MKKIDWSKLGPPPAGPAVPAPSAPVPEAPVVVARRMIPGMLTRICQALNEGNPSSVQGMIAPNARNNFQMFDTICKPFTYRAHYIERIVERPNNVIQAWVRVLAKPLDERGYALDFKNENGSLVLVDVADPPEEWFGPELSEARDLARRFMYASMAGRRDVLESLVPPGVDISHFADGPCWQTILGGQVKAYSAKMISYKGLQAEVTIGGAQTQSFSFLVGSVDGQYKIVSPYHNVKNEYVLNYDPKQVCGSSTWEFMHNLGQTEDPNLATRTLARFNLQGGE